MSDSNISRQTSSGRSESVPRTIRKMKITARVESPPPVSRTPTPSPQTQPSVSLTGGTKPIPRNFVSPTPTAATSRIKVGLPKTENIESFTGQRIKSPTFNEAIRSPSPTPVDQRREISGGRQDIVRSPVSLRVKSPLPFKNIRRGMESPAVMTSDLPPTPQSRVQSPAPSRVQSPTLSNGSRDSTGGDRKSQNSAGDQLFCDQPSKQERTVQEWKIDSFSQEVIIETLQRISQDRIR